MERVQKETAAERMPHQLTLRDRSHLELSGVTDVGTFDENGVTLTTTAGRLRIVGSGLHLSCLTLETGAAVIEGTVDGLEYSKTPTRGGFFGRLLR